MKRIILALLSIISILVISGCTVSDNQHDSNETIYYVQDIDIPTIYVPNIDVKETTAPNVDL